MIHLCRHIMPGGKLCEQAAVKDTMFCRHHGTVKAALEREQAAPGPEVAHTPLALVYPEDKAAIQLNLFLVLEALNQKRIDVRTANAMNRLLRSCEQNLRTGTLAEPNREKVAQQVITLPNGDEISMPREAVEATEALLGPDEIHGLGCLCEECEGKAAHLPKERHHAACRCGACIPAADATGKTVREATQLELHNVPPEPFDMKDAPAWLAAEQEESSYQNTILKQYKETKTQAQQKQNQQTQAQQAQAQQAQPTRKQQERDEAMMDTLAAEYELRTESEVNWKQGMKEALLEDFKQAIAEDRPYTPRDLAACEA